MLIPYLTFIWHSIVTIKSQGFLQGQNFKITFLVTFFSVKLLLPYCQYYTPKLEAISLRRQYVHYTKVFSFRDDQILWYEIFFASLYSKLLLFEHPGFESPRGQTLRVWLFFCSSSACKGTQYLFDRSNVIL